jgi:hypothetical protein
MKFKDKISFLSYVVDPNNYGPIDICFSNLEFGQMELTIQPIENGKSLLAPIHDTLYDLFWFHFFDTVDLLEFSPNFDYQSFVLQLNNGELELANGNYSYSHDFENDEIQEELQDLLIDEIGQDYLAIIHISGRYNKPEQLTINQYSISYFDDEDNEVDLEDEVGAIKNQVISSLITWAINYSENMTGGEYEFETFDLDFSISSYPNQDTWCHFNEECEGTIFDISVFEVNPEVIEIENL